MKKMAVVADFRKQAVNKAIKSFRLWVSHRAEVVGWFQDPQSLKKHINNQRVDYILVFGGDGLLLSTAKQLEGEAIPVLGVNFGKLGFLTEVAVDELHEILEHIFQNHCQVALRMMLECQVIREGKVIKSSLALNDGVVRASHSQASRLLYCKLSINGEEVSTYGGDGVIVATPTGSTAYSLSAGGPVLSPNLPALIITPICPHMLNMRSLVVSAEEQIEIRFATPFPGEAIFSADGEVQFDLKENDAVRIQRSQKSFYLLETGRVSFYKVLRNKLSWGEGNLKKFK